MRIHLSMVFLLVFGVFSAPGYATTDLKGTIIKPVEDPFFPLTSPWDLLRGIKLKFKFYVDGLVVNDGHLYGTTIYSFGPPSQETIGYVYRYDLHTGAMLGKLSFPIVSGPNLIGGSLGYDSDENLFLIGDNSRERLLFVDPNTGSLVKEYHVDAGVLGVSYDRSRKGYWLNDAYRPHSTPQERNRIVLIDPKDGHVVRSCPVPKGTRISGLAYDEKRDVLFYNGRNEFQTYAMDAKNCALANEFATPGLHQYNGGDGIALSDSGDDLYISNIENLSTYRIEIPK